MGLGLQGAFGLEGLDQLVAQRKAEKIAAQLRAQKVQQQQFENQLKLRNESRLEAVMKGQEADRAAGRQEQDFTRAGQINQATPEGTFMPEGDQGAKLMQSAGYGGFLKRAPSIAAQGPDFQGPTENATIQDYQQGRPGGFIKSATAQQLAEQAKEKAVNLKEQQLVQHENEVAAETRRHNRVMENKPSASADRLIQVKTLDKDGHPIIRYMSPQDIRNEGGTFDSQRSAVTQNRLDSATAVNDVGRRIQKELSNPEVAANLGPIMGRYTSLRDFLGNPPPEYSRLAGEIESFALANMGVHGMRSSVGADKIKSMLSAQHTPESLSQGIEGLLGFSNDFMKNAGLSPAQNPSAGASPATKPTLDRSIQDLLKR
jgi:hypothetical protein